MDEVIGYIPCYNEVGTIEKIDNTEFRRAPE